MDGERHVSVSHLVVHFAHYGRDDDDPDDDDDDDPLLFLPSRLRLPASERERGSEGRVGVGRVWKQFSGRERREEKGKKRPLLSRSLPSQCASGERPRERRPSLSSVSTVSA